jgi:hypothetical protein
MRSSGFSRLAVSWFYLIRRGAVIDTIAIGLPFNSVENKDLMGEPALSQSTGLHIM